MIRVVLILVQGSSMDKITILEARVHLASFSVPIRGLVFRGKNLSGREPAHLPPPGAKVKNAWRYTYSSPYLFITWLLITRRDNF
jgi:hypothetical protein